MTFEKIRKKLWSRITESRWTIAYISFAILKMIISIALEAVILQKNETSLESVYDYIEFKVPEPDNREYSYNRYSYDKYSMQFQSIIHGNIWFMVLEIFLTALCFSAVFFQNTIEVVTVVLIELCLIFLAGTQIIQSIRWIDRVNSQLKYDNIIDPGLSRDVILWEVILILFSIGSIIALMFFGYKLYKQFGWNIYKEIGANIQTQRMYRTYLVFVLLLKLDLFLLMGFQILNLVFLFNDDDQRQTIILQSIMVAIVIPMVGLAMWGVRRENKVAMFIFAMAAVITIGNFLYILAKFIINRDENLLTLLDILGILLAVMSMLVAYLAVRNFDNGLKDHFERNNGDTVNLEARGQRKRFSIDD